MSKLACIALVAVVMTCAGCSAMGMGTNTSSSSSDNSSYVNSSYGSNMSQGGQESLYGGGRR